jgi:type I restriction enzyme S subunit
MNVPALRFKDDAGLEFPEWEEKTLGEIGKFVGGGTPSTKEIKFWNGNIPWISSSDLTDENIFQINTTRFITQEAISQSATKLVPKNSILIVSRVGVGKVAINNQEICTSQDFTNLILHSGNNIFFAYLIKFKTNKLLEFNQGTSIKGFVKSDLESFKVSTPSLPEQTKIANFLTAVDDKITLLTKKADLLSQYKKGVMQQIFSQELRFKDDDGQEFPEWEEKDFNDVFHSISTKQFQILNSEISKNGKFKVVDQGQNDIAGYSNDENKIFTDLPVVIFGDHTTVLKYIDFKFVIGADGTKLLKQNFGNLKFLYYCLVFNKIETEGYKRHYSILKEIKLFIPESIEEQTKIANFLTAFDEKITNNQTQLDAVKQYKQGLLQQMFV